MAKDDKHGYTGLFRAIEKRYCELSDKGPIPSHLYNFTTEEEMCNILEQMIQELEPGERNAIKMYFRVSNSPVYLSNDIEENPNLTRVTIDTRRRKAIYKLATVPLIQKLFNRTEIWRKGQRIEIAGLSTRAYRIVKRAGIKTIDELISTINNEPQQLEKIWNCGVAVMEELVNKVQEINMGRNHYACFGEFVVSNNLIRFQSETETRILADVLRKYTQEHPEDKDIETVNYFQEALEVVEKAQKLGIR